MKPYIKCGKGRGRRINHATHIKKVAKTILSYKGSTDKNAPYFVMYFWKQLEGHHMFMRMASEDTSKIYDLYKEAHDFAKQFCEGKDCSFQDN